MPDIHRAASEGYAASAAAYVAGRPGYPPEIVDWLRADLGLSATSAILDLGAGTGKLLPSLLATGARIAAVEPVAAMREHIAARHPGVTALPGTAEVIPLPDGSLDAVVCGQSFHWFATRAALAEIARVLRPGGALGLIWNVRDESVDWVAALAGIVDPYEGAAPRYRTGDWRRPFPAEGFGALQERRFAHAHVGSPEAVIVSRVLSVSFIAALPDSERAAVAARVRTLIAASPEIADRDDVALPYETVAFFCRRSG